MPLIKSCKAGNPKLQNHDIALDELLQGCFGVNLCMRPTKFWLWKQTWKLANMEV